MDEASERYFAAFRADMATARAGVPSSYSSVALGHVSPVKNQKQCGEQTEGGVYQSLILGSCTAFANMALIETCFKRKTGAFGQDLFSCI